MQFISSSECILLPIGVPPLDLLRSSQWIDILVVPRSLNVRERKEVSWINEPHLATMGVVRLGQWHDARIHTYTCYCDI
jgi:hypothetical protein